LVKASLLAFSSKRLALDWLKLITDQTFDSPEQWVQWWQKNHSNLILSADGRKLVHPDEMLPRGMAGPASTTGDEHSGDRLHRDRTRRELLLC